ncbi:hypothetical protein M1M38_gp070 [Halorubrum tailed virus 27]|uniref:Uncharacterized protein n=1 Tax=Halorubrum tailed virus 27 TaxID=2878008 RepID=A0AAE9BY58_9CAUD|nr:hypothetical protein M1M38_gp070 [Halorubrum tailed virus 27]UBF22763.1 hypothetical protein HRTV-27_gp70 [Halorubrum tailed virus 27]
MTAPHRRSLVGPERDRSAHGWGARPRWESNHTLTPPTPVEGHGHGAAIEDSKIFASAKTKSRTAVLI